MRIAVVGRGTVGGGLAGLWRDAGHDVTEFGRDGGDVSDAEAVLLAVPGGEVASAFETVGGFEGRTVIDATNLLQGERPQGFDSLAEFVKSRTNGPVAKGFNLNFARVYDRLGEARARPSNPYCGDEEAREVFERLSQDAGYEAVYAGGLENARVLEDALGFLFAIMQAGMGPFVYRMAPPDQL